MTSTFCFGNYIAITLCYSCTASSINSICITCTITCIYSCCNYIAITYCNC